MSPLRLTAVFLALLGVANAADDPRPTNEEWKKKRAEQDAQAADEQGAADKRSAVDKVVTLLEDLQKQVLEEGEKEAASYNKFSCFCKTDQANKEKAIQEEKDAKESLTADINKLTAGRVEDDKTITGLEKDIKDLNDEMDVKKEDGKKALKTYEEEKADLSKALSGIEGALQVLKASKPALLQLKSISDTVREALVMADALGLGADTLQGATAAFLQEAPEVQVENYKFHSESVIKTLEKLLKEFRQKKVESDEAEVQRLKEYDMFMQEKTDGVKAKTVELENTQKSRDDKIAEIADKSQKLTVESANLLEDQIYLQELYRTCGNKKETWDKRSQVRADELSAIASATAIIKDVVHEKTSKATLRFAQRGVTVRLAEAVAQDEQSMEAVEAAAEELEGGSQLSFLQRRSMSRRLPNEAVNRISDLLRKTAVKTKSTLLTGLATQIAIEAPKGMEKVKTLIEELIKRLEAQAAAEATQKGWCDKAIADATTKRRTTTNAVNELNDSLAKLEADRKLLTNILKTLAKDIKDLKDAKDKADKLRGEEKTENEATIKMANEGKTAVESAITILADFYKEAAKKEDGESGKKEDAPKVDSPDAGFSEGEAYKGAQSSATGVLGMLDVIKSDFERTVKETEQAESEGVDDHKAFTKTTEAVIKEKEDIEKARKKEKDDADSQFDTDKTSLKETMDRVISAVKELMQLQKTCIDTAMSYAERVARREEEIESLRKALCILGSFSSYGADPAKYDPCS